MGRCELDAPREGTGKRCVHKRIGQSQPFLVSRQMCPSGNSGEATTCPSCKNLREYSEDTGLLFLPMICWWVNGMPELLYLIAAQLPGSICIRSGVAVETSTGPSYNACKVQGVGDVLPPDVGNNKNSVLVRAPVAVKKHHKQKQSWKEFISLTVP